MGAKKSVNINILTDGLTLKNRNTSACSWKSYLSKIEKNKPSRN